jgi:hypothetical protein
MVGREFARNGETDEQRDMVGLRDCALIDVMFYTFARIARKPKCRMRRKPRRAARAAGNAGWTTPADPVYRADERAVQFAEGRST